VLNLRSGRWLGFELSSRLVFAIAFQGLHPARIDGSLGKAGQLGQEFMGCSGKNRLGVVFAWNANHLASVAGGKVEDRLPQANQDVLRLPAD
jgi:hypothetical protein